MYLYTTAAPPSHQLVIKWVRHRLRVVIVWKFFLCLTIIPQSHLMEIVYLICWSNGVLWNRYFLSELFFQSLYFLRSATFSKQLLFHKSYFFLLTVLFIIESFQSLKKPGVYRVVHPSENFIFKCHDLFLTVAHTALPSLKKSYLKSFASNLFFQSSIERTISLKLRKISSLIKTLISVLNQLKATIHDLLSLTAIYSTRNVNSYYSEMKS